MRARRDFPQAGPAKTRDVAKTPGPNHALPDLSDNVRGDHLVSICHSLGVAKTRGVNKNTWRLSRRHVSKHDVTCSRGVTTPRGVNVPRGVARCGVTTPRGVTKEFGVTRCGMRPWRHELMWRQKATWRHRTRRWRVVSLAPVGSSCCCHWASQAGEGTASQEKVPLATCQRAPVITARGVKNSRGIVAHAAATAEEI